MSHSLKVLVAFITLDELSNSLKDDSIVTVIAAKALECLSLAISGMSGADLLNVISRLTIIQSITRLTPMLL